MSSAKQAAFASFFQPHKPKSPSKAKDKTAAASSSADAGGSAAAGGSGSGSAGTSPSKSRTPLTPLVQARKKRTAEEELASKPWVEK